MKTEIEVKFLDINFISLREKLTALGGVCVQPMRLMRRVVIQNEATGHNNYLRVRDEGDKVTMTFKAFKSLSLHGASEIETVVGNFDDTVAILAASGLASKTYQESKRETWYLGEAEVVLDEWPWLQPYIEIEGSSEVIVREAAAKLGFDWDTQAVFGDVMAAYRKQYPHLTEKDTVGNAAEVKFGAPLPAFLES